MGLTPTGKQFREPAATLLGHQDPRGLEFTVVAFDAAYRGQEALGRAVELVRSFLAYPMVIGLVELSHVDLEHGRFGYPTGPHWTLKELLRIHADLSRKMGLRAGLEVAYLVGQILVEAAENGAVQGCFSHSGLTPWRISVRPEGDVIVFGHGLPQIDLLCHRVDPAFPVSADSVRYAPPERLAGLPEDLAADTAALTAITYEVVTGQPLYAGHDVEAVSKAIGLGEGAQLVSRSSELPPPVAQVFARALAYDPDSRLTGQAWLAEIGELYERFKDGDSLPAIVDRVRGAAPSGPPRRAARFLGTQTSFYTPEQLRAAAEARSTAEAPEPAPQAEKKVETRWSRPVRRRSDETPEPAPESESSSSPSETPEVGATTRPRRRLRDGSDPSEPASNPTDAGIPQDEVGYRTKESLREAALAEDDDEEDDVALEPADRPRRRADAPSDTATTRRRRRRIEDPSG